MRWSQYPLCFYRVVLTVLPSLPVFPDERTTSEPAGMSQTCYKQTRVLGWFRSKADASTFTDFERFVEAEAVLENGGGQLHFTARVCQAQTPIEACGEVLQDR